MQFEKCLRCSAIKEKKCAGPNFMAMSTKELVEWEINYQKLNGITNAQLAEWSGIPKGTIDGIKYRDDVRHDTIYHILKALIEGSGGAWGGEPCPLVGEKEKPIATEKPVETETKQLYEQMLKTKTKWLQTLFIVCCVLIAALVTILLISTLNS